MISESKIVVRYAETDQMGIVHHCVYPVWYEVARTDFIKKMGMSYTEMERKGVMMPVVEVRSKYISPAYYEDELTVQVKIKHFNPAKIEFEYNIYRDLNSDAINTGFTVHALTDTSIKLINLKKKFPEIYNMIKNTFDN